MYIINNYTSLCIAKAFDAPNRCDYKITLNFHCKHVCMYVCMHVQHIYV